MQQTETESREKLESSSCVSRQAGNRVSDSLSVPVCFCGERIPSQLQEGTEVRRSVGGT